MHLNSTSRHLVTFFIPIKFSRIPHNQFFLIVFTGLSLGGDLGEKVSQSWLTSPYFELREKFKYREIQNLDQNFSLEPWKCRKISPCLKAVGWPLYLANILTFRNEGTIVWTAPFQDCWNKTTRRVFGKSFLLLYKITIADFSFSKLTSC